jgi:hypothetical protein
MRLLVVSVVRLAEAELAQRPTVQRGLLAVREQQGESS